MSNLAHETSQVTRDTTLAATSPRDVVMETLRRAGRPLTAVQIWDGSDWAIKEHGLARRYSVRTVGDALSLLRRDGNVCQDGERGPYLLPDRLVQAPQLPEMTVGFP